ncbi:hypothetical protein [Novosphingobium sp.]|uniref:hypothetical protein n=1 Tax=Novosphingobium sp. TaxID=1874826 RepID=UPI00261205B9|nr:hypothetical protein [Novosphingobium sp.]
MVNHEDETRARKLRGLLGRLKQGKNVQNRDLQTWLGAVGYKRYVAAWAAQLDLRDVLDNKPDAIVEYEARLKRANFTFNRAERYSQKGNHTAAKKLFGAADIEYEQLLERLQEIIAADPSLNMWFDRGTSWTWDGENNIEPELVPQVVTSKGQFNRTPNGGLKMGKMDKRAVKIDVIKHELARLECGDLTSELLAKRRAGIRNVHPERDSD